MPEPENNEQTEQPTEETAEVKPDEQPKDDSQQEQPAGEQPEAESEEAEETEEGGEELPEWAREKLTKANAEAANYRTKLREAEEKLKTAKTPEEVEAVVKEITAEREASERALLVENVALKYKLPAKLAKRLHGNTREELEADAKELVEFAEESEEVVLEGGLSPRNRDEDATAGPGELRKKYGQRKRR